MPPLLLASALLLASCGGTTAPKTGTAPSPQPIASGVTASVEQPLISGLDASGLLRLSGVTPSQVSVAVRSAPSGLTVTAGTPSASGGDTLVSLSATGTAPKASSVQLSVTTGGTTATVSVPVLDMRVYPIQGAGQGYQASALRVHPDGSLLLRADTSGTEAQRHSLLHFDPQAATFTLQSFPIGLGLETITSHAVAPDGRVWVTVRGLTTQGSYLLGRSASGEVQKFFVQATNLNALTATPDGQLWFIPYGKSSVMALNPATGTFTTQPTEETAEALTLGHDGLLYHTRVYAKPAIIQRQPGSGSTKAFEVGKANVSLPSAISAAPDGTLWYIEARTGSVWHLSPQTGKHSQVSLPIGARPNELAAAPDGTLWITDPTAGQLYRVSAGSLKSTTVPALKTASGAPSGPRALAVTPSGQVWYEADGKLVTVY